MSAVQMSDAQMSADQRSADQINVLQSTRNDFDHTIISKIRALEHISAHLFAHNSRIS